MYELTQIEGLRGHFQLARLNLGEVQNIVDQFEQRFAGVLRRLQVFAKLFYMTYPRDSFR